MYCRTEQFSIVRLSLERGEIDIFPVHRNPSEAWGREKQQLFLSSLFSEYDTPKIYLHELDCDIGERACTLVDGRQRLRCIWDFVDGKISLGDGFDDFVPHKCVARNRTVSPKRGDFFGDLSEFWREQFKAICLDVVVIEDANADDIADLFCRLENGESLGATKRQNAEYRATG